MRQCIEKQFKCNHDDSNRFMIWLLHYLHCCNGISLATTINRLVWFAGSNKLWQMEFWVSSGELTNSTTCRTALFTFNGLALFQRQKMNVTGKTDRRQTSCQSWDAPLLSVLFGDGSIPNHSNFFHARHTHCFCLHWKWELCTVPWWAKVSKWTFLDPSSHSNLITLITSFLPSGLALSDYSGCHNKYHSLVGLNNRSFFPHNSGGWSLRSEYQYPPGLPTRTLALPCEWLPSGLHRTEGDTQSKLSGVYSSEASIS